MITTLATRYLERRGHVVIPAGAGHEIIGGYVVFPVDMGLKVLPACTPIVAPGFRAVPVSARILPTGYSAKRERAPDVGTVWTPRTGEPRTVVGLMGDEVTYRTATMERTVKVGSFNDWRRDTGAVGSKNG